MEKETLTKENFWDDMEQKYPKAMAHFKAWIDQYKTEHDWEYLFNVNVRYEQAGVPGRILLTISPKYHELPIAMQFGIFLEWLQSYPKQKFRVYLFERKELEGYSSAYLISFLAIVRAVITRGLIKMESEL